MFTGTKFENQSVSLTSGNKRYWKFTGEAYSKFEEFAQLVVAAGENLWLPGYGVLYSRARYMTHDLCDLLAAFVQLQDVCGLNWLRYAEDFPTFNSHYARGFTTNYGDLLYLGMAESTTSDHRTHGKKWRPTAAGRAFIQSAGECPEFVVVQGSTIVRTSDKQLKLEDFYEDSDIHKFNNIPLWWIPEENRDNFLHNHLTTAVDMV